MMTPRSGHGMTAVRNPENFCTTKQTEKQEKDHEEKKENEAAVI